MVLTTKKMNKFPKPSPISSNGLVLKNVRCTKCGKIQWTYAVCRFCNSKQVVEVLPRKPKSVCLLCGKILTTKKEKFHLVCASCFAI